MENSFIFSELTFNLLLFYPTFSQVEYSLCAGVHFAGCKSFFYQENAR